VRRVPLSRFSHPNSFSAKPRASGTVFMFCAPGLIFDVTEGVWSRFNVKRCRIRFRRYRGRRVPFSCFARPDSFSMVPRASGSVFIFSSPGLVFDGTEGVGSRFHVLRARTIFRRYRGCRVPLFCAPGLLFDGAECVGSLIHVLRAQTHFRRLQGRRVASRFQRYRVRRVSISRFPCPDSFLAVPRASGPIFTFCPPRLVFGDTEGVVSRFHVLRARTRFRLY
jgi:hypothetical protein